MELSRLIQSTVHSARVLLAKLFHPLPEFVLATPAHLGLFDRLQSSKTGKEGSCGQGKETADRKSREKTAVSRRETLQDDETKFAALVRSHREAEKRCKFEELQAASRKLERRLYEEDDHLRASKERSAAR